MNNFESEYFFGVKDLATKCVDCSRPLESGCDSPLGSFSHWDETRFVSVTLAQCVGGGVRNRTSAMSSLSHRWQIHNSGAYEIHPGCECAHKTLSRWRCSRGNILRIYNVTSCSLILSPEGIYPVEKNKWAQSHMIFKIGVKSKK